MIISQLPELFVQRERALLGPRFDAMFSYPGQGAVRGASVNALRCTPQQFAALADFPLEASPFCASAFVVPQPDWKPGRHPYHHAGAFYAQEPSASAPAALLDVHPGMRVADLCAAPGGKTSQLAAALAGQADAPKLLKGAEGLRALACMDGAGTVLNAVVGIAGLDASLAAIESGHDLALANKESLVTGGHLVTDAVKKHGVHLLPVDSEHSAIFQCLQDQHSAKTLEKILLTASGGPFFGMTTEQLRTKTKADALKHPNWNMGAKITIDSATLMNKGLELIEAAWLFGLPEDKIQIVVQRESIIHSAVQFADHSIIAQLGVPDMRIPIQYALTWPERLPSPVPELDFTALTKLSIATADDETFRCLKACKKAIRKGGLAPCAANGANEAAVAHFLRDEIGFLDIGRLVEGIVDSDSFGGDYTLADVHECDRMARAYVEAHI